MLIGIVRVGDVVAERFELLSLAGSGGMGAVFRARDLQDAREVALKVQRGGITPEEVLRFEREAQVLEQVRHPCVVEHVAHGKTARNQAWIAMEWIDGEDLHTRLKRGRLTIEESLELASGLASALAAAHERGVVHRDVKPHNVMLAGGDPRAPKLLDFGVARVELDSSIADLTEVGQIVGTPAYMAPEQARADATVDARADVFSLGCVMYACLSGRAPFVGENLVALLTKVLFTDVPRVSSSVRDVAPPLDELVALMMSKDRERRPRDGVAVLRALRMIDAPRAAYPQRSPSVRPGALGAREQRWACVLVAAMDAATIMQGARAERTEVDAASGLFTVVRQSGARLEVLANGSHVVVWSGTGTTVDASRAAARAALAVREALGEVPIGLASGRASTDDAQPVGAAVERAAALADRSTGEVLVDEELARMLAGRFDLERRGDSFVLGAERDARFDARTLLGKPTPCVGRDVELATLAAMFAECVEEGVAAAALVTGDVGIGKSRVRYEFARALQASHPAARIWSAQGDVVSEGAVFGVAAALVRDACGVGLGETKSAVRAKIVARVSEHVPPADRARVASRLCEMAGAPWESEVDEALANGRREPIVMGDQLRVAWEDFLVAECADAPVVLVIEDLQWADRASVALVDRALRNFGKRPWMVIGVGRPEIAERLPKLWADHGVRESSLGPLKDRAAERLVRAVLGDGHQAERVARIVERAAGNAYVLEELVRAEAEGHGDAVPETVLAMVEARLLRLGAESRRVLRAASVYGARFEARGVAAVLEDTTGEETLESLVAQEWLASLPNGGYAFRQATVRDAAYATWVEDEARLAHLRAAEWLEAGSEGEAATVADHFERAEAEGRAAAWWTKAAEQALEGNDFAAALVRADRAIACGVQGEALARSWLAKVEAHSWRGDSVALLESARAAANVPDASVDVRAEATRWIVVGGQRLARRDVVSEAVARLSETVDAHGERPRVLVAALAGSTAAFAAGDRDAAEALAEKADRAAERIAAPDALLRAWVLTTDVYRTHTRHESETYARGGLAAARALAEAGAVRRACVQRGNAGYGLLLLGAHREAIDVLEEALAEATRLGVPRAAAVTQHNLGLALSRCGDHAGAERAERAAIEFAIGGKDKHWEALSRDYLARILVNAGRAAEAEAEARKAAELLPPAQHSGVVWVSLADALLARGDAQRRAEALELVRRAHATLVAGASQLHDEPSIIWRVYIDALEANGMHDEAAAARERARAWLVESAAHIDSEHYRHTFLYEEPDNARIMAR